MKRLVETLIAALPNDLRGPLQLSTVEEMSAGEIAVVVGIPEATVRTRLFRARQVLKEKLAALMEVKS
jgi:RNA polymerase sigma-70 factor (ECF subfamily)